MENLDPGAVALTKAIGQTESGGNYNAVGDNGNSHGAYQFQKGTWQQYAKDTLGDPNAPMTPENQNKVAYTKIKEWKDQGYTPAQIASKWNSGGFDTYKNQNAQGYNAQQGVSFNVPEYVAKVSQAFRNNMGMGTAQAQGYNPKPFSSGAVDFSGIAPNAQDGQQQPSDTLGSEINSRVQDLTTGLGSLVGGKAATGQTRLSGLLQTGGAIGGAIGDVTNKALELIPGVKGLENLLGKGIGALAQTPAGQSVTNAIQSFSQAHPELSKDIGAGFNIVTAIPIVRGLGAVASVAGDAASSALKGVAERGFQSDLESAGARTVGGRKMLSQVPDIAKTIVDERAIPDISGGKYTTEAASKVLNSRIGTLDDQLQQNLEKGNVAQVAQRIPLETLRQSAVQDAVDNLLPKDTVNSIFDSIKEKYGDYLTLQQTNEAKRSIAKQIAESAFNDPAASARKIARSTLQKAVEDGASQAGLEDVGQINQQMRKLIQAQKFLDTYVNNRKPGEGFLGKLVKQAPFVGNVSEDAIQTATGKIKSGILKRTGKNAVRTSLSTAAKRAGVMAATSAARKAISSQGKGE